MGIKTPFHPEITTGSLENFGSQKIKQQVKSIYVNMITDFFMYSKKIHKLDIPELASMTNTKNVTKLYIERDFPFTERKIPLILPSISAIKERKAYLGIDNFLYPEVSVAEDGTRSGFDVYANMYDIDLKIYVITESSDLRDKLNDALMACFTNYYRGSYIYTDGDADMFNITPSTREVIVGGENEIPEEAAAGMIYVSDVTLSAFVEYHYKAVGEDRYRQINTVETNPLSGPAED